MKHKGMLSRRALLGALGAGSGALILDGFLGLRHARADVGDPDDAPLLVLCEFASGWDTLYSLDPRNHQQFGDPAAGIYTGFDLVTDPATQKAIDDTGGTGLVKPNGSNITFGPAIGKLAAEHYEELCVIRGVNMGTLTHEVGRRYFLTGKFPRGLAASGSSLETWWAAASGELGGYQIPSLVGGGAETYNEGLSPLASGLSVPDYNAMLQVLRPLNAAVGLDGKVTQAAAEFHHGPFCVERQLDATGQVSTHLSAWSSAQSLANGGLWKHFDFKANPTAGSPLDKLYDTFSVNKASPASTLAGKPRGQAALAAQALTNRISQVVLLRLVNVTDAHFEDNWPSNHPAQQRAGFEAVSELITFLKNTEDKNGKSFWDRTTLVCFSEFARSPVINPQGGRDHHLSSACLVAGQGIKGNLSVGGNRDSNYDSRPMNLSTGAPDDDFGTIVKPSDVHATVLHAAGLPYDHISNQSPQLIKAILKNG
ncbi:Tat (Twin-arginine translocation) pathway signal sequence domain protein [Minicystis rosea]|nr:Tat (Twin-arginine translocation) pathway signal sequence domain protein [Minicystis rosea]